MPTVLNKMQYFELPKEVIFKIDKFLPQTKWKLNFEATCSHIRKTFSKNFWPNIEAISIDQSDGESPLRISFTDGDRSITCEFKQADTNSAIDNIRSLLQKPGLLIRKIHLKAVDANYGRICREIVLNLNKIELKQLKHLELFGLFADDVQGVVINDGDISRFANSLQSLRIEPLRNLTMIECLSELPMENLEVVKFGFCPGTRSNFFLLLNGKPAIKRLELSFPHLSYQETRTAASQLMTLAESLRSDSLKELVLELRGSDNRAYLAIFAAYILRSYSALENLVPVEKLLLIHVDTSKYVDSFLRMIPEIFPNLVHFRRNFFRNSYVYGVMHESKDSWFPDILDSLYEMVHKWLLIPTVPSSKPKALTVTYCTVVPIKERDFRGFCSKFSRKQDAVDLVINGKNGIVSSSRHAQYKQVAISNKVGKLCLVQFRNLKEYE